MNSKYRVYAVFFDGKQIGRVDGTDEDNAADNARSKFQIEHNVSVQVVWLHTGKIDGSM